MFLNYTLHYSERHLFGVRICTGDEDNTVETYMRFNLLMFGGRPCPYVAVQGHARAMEIAHGNRTDQENPLHWISVVENYPFTKNYDPSLPR